jgi:hypothetical protein
VSHILLLRVGQMRIHEHCKCVPSLGQPPARTEVRPGYQQSAVGLHRVRRPRRGQARPGRERRFTAKVFGPAETINL